MTRRELLRTAAAAAAGAAFPAAADPARAAPSPGAPETQPRAPATTPHGPATRPGARTVLLYSGWATHNIGDVGHTPGTLRYFAEFLPDVRVVCWMRRTNDAVTAMLRRRFPDVPIVQGDLSGTGQASTPDLRAAFESADLFVQNSGMHFNRFWRPPTGLLTACVAAGKPFGLYGQSFDGVRPEDAGTLPPLLSKAAFIFTRDTESLAFLRGAGVTPGVLEFGPDGCFGTDVRDDAAADAFMARHGLEVRKFITVTIRTDMLERYGPKAGLPDGAAQVAATVDGWCAKVRELVTAWVRRTGLKVALVPEVEKEVAAARARVLDRLPDDVRANVGHRDAFWNVDEATSLYSRARAVVSMEPHSCIMALAAGTPAIHWFSPVHGTKAWMFRDVGLPEWLFDIDAGPAAAVSAALDRVHDRYDLALAKVKRAMDGVHRRSAEMATDVRRAAGAPA